MLDLVDYCHETNATLNLLADLSDTSVCIPIERISAEQRLVVVYGTEATLGLIFNIILITAIKLGSNTSKGVHVHLINMAVADILYGISLFYQLLSYFWYIDQQISPCILQTLITIGISSCSKIWTLTLSIERCVVTYFPFKALQYTHRMKVAVSVLVWVSGFLIAIYPSTLVETKHQNYFIGDQLETELPKTSYTKQRCYSTGQQKYLFVYGMAFPVPVFITTLLMYALIACKLCRYKQAGDVQQPRFSIQYKQVSRSILNWKLNIND